MTVLVDPTLHVGELIATTEVEAPTFNGGALTATTGAFSGTLAVAGLITLPTGDASIRFASGSFDAIPVIRGVRLTGDSAADVTVSGTANGLFHIVNAYQNYSALVFHDGGLATPIIIAQSAAGFTTAAPGATQTQLKNVGGVLKIRSGASISGNIYSCVFMCGLAA